MFSIAAANFESQFASDFSKPPVLWCERMAGNDAAIFHFVEPIARLGNYGVVCGEEQRLAAFMHKFLQQLKRALGVWCRDCPSVRRPE